MRWFVSLCGFAIEPRITTKGSLPPIRKQDWC